VTYVTFYVSYVVQKTSQNRIERIESHSKRGVILTKDAFPQATIMRFYGALTSLNPVASSVQLIG
jgi:hypothetical protein